MINLYFIQIHMPVLLFSNELNENTFMHYLKLFFIHKFTLTNDYILAYIYIIKKFGIEN